MMRTRRRRTAALLVVLAVTSITTAGSQEAEPSLVAFRVLHDRPCKAVFTPAAAQDQNVHPLSPCCGPVTNRRLHRGTAGNRQEDAGGRRTKELCLSARVGWPETENKESSNGTSQ